MQAYMELFEKSVYAFDGKDNILEDKNIGICANVASVLTSPHTVTGMEGFQGCPYTNTGFAERPSA